MYYVFFFKNVDMFVKVKLFKAYCGSMYGCEIWSLDDVAIDEYCIAWRKSLRRVLDLPYNCHSVLLPLIADSLPVFDEICKRSARFIASCLFYGSPLVQSIACYGVTVARYNSIIGGNALFCCERFGWSIDDFMLGKVDLHSNNFLHFCRGQVSDVEKRCALAVLELICIREGYFSLGPADGLFLSRGQLNDIIGSIAC